MTLWPPGSTTSPWTSPISPSLRVDLLASTHVDFADREGGVGGRQGDVAGVVGPQQRPIPHIGLELTGRAGQEMDRLRGRKGVEGGCGALQVDLARRRVHQVERDQSAETLAMFRFDHQMGYPTGDRVDRDAPELPTNSIGAADFGPEHELRRPCHLYLRFCSRCHPNGLRNYPVGSRWALSSRRRGATLPR